MIPWAGLVPYVVAFGVGFSGAWWVQSVRLDSAENEFSAYKLAQGAAALRHVEQGIARAERTTNAYEKARRQLADYLESRRVRDSVPASGDGLRLPPAAGADDSGGTTVPAAGESTEALIAACARVQLQLNALQNDIEEQ
jgi:hypothetical protein